MVDGLHADGLRAIDVRRDIIDEDGVARPETAGAAHEVVDLRTRFGAADPSRHHVVTETAEEGMARVGRPPQPVVEEGRRVRQEIKRRSGPVRKYSSPKTYTPRSTRSAISGKAWSSISSKRP